MIDDISDIRDFYNQGNPKYEHSRLVRHQLEHDLTWRYLEKYLPSKGKILEIGAATGRYTLELVRRGYTVTAVDFAETLLNDCRKRISKAGLKSRATFVVADARDLGVIPQRSYDAVLLMGPLYHLVVKKDRIKVLREAWCRLKSGGVICSSFLSRYGILGDQLKNKPEWIERQSEVRYTLDQGREDPEDRPKGGFRGYFATADEIAPLHERIGFETLALAGIEPGISADDLSYNCLEGKRRKLWLDLFYKVSRVSSTIGASRHLLYVGNKPIKANR